MDFTHFNDNGRARMVDVSEKSDSVRTAVAAGRVRMNRETFALVKTGGMKKGDLIPMCHTLLLSGVDLDLALNEDDCAVDITATVKCTGQTGVEMEALTAVSVAALTVYDMCKAVQRDMEITDIRLLKKTGGKSGVFER